MTVEITYSCMKSICARLRCKKQDIKSVKIGASMFIVNLANGAIGTVDYDFYDATYSEEDVEMLDS